MYLVVGRRGRRRLVECSSVGIFWYLRKIPRINREKSLEGILELVPMGIGEVIPEGITGGKLSCGGLVVSIPDGIFKKESSGKIFSILFPDLTKKFSSD